MRIVSGHAKNLPIMTARSRIAGRNRDEIVVIVKSMFSGIIGLFTERRIVAERVGFCVTT